MFFIYNFSDFCITLTLYPCTSVYPYFQQLHLVWKALSNSYISIWPLFSATVQNITSVQVRSCWITSYFSKIYFLPPMYRHHFWKLCLLGLGLLGWNDFYLFILPTHLLFRAHRPARKAFWFTLACDLLYLFMDLFPVP